MKKVRTQFRHKSSGKFTHGPKAVVPVRIAAAIKKMGQMTKTRKGRTL
jgi:hypothetical protein